jgi:hypothetical protein
MLQAIVWAWRGRYQRDLHLIHKEHIAVRRYQLQQPLNLAEEHRRLSQFVTLIREFFKKHSIEVWQIRHQKDEEFLASTLSYSVNQLRVLEMAIAAKEKNDPRAFPHARRSRSLTALRSD